MFNSKKLISDLSKRLQQAEKTISEFPEIKICCECGEVKSKIKFQKRNIQWLGVFQEYKDEDMYNNHCNLCREIIEGRKEAEEFANENYEKVLKIKKQSIKKKTRAKK